MQSKEEIYLISYSIGRLGDIIASNVPASNNNFFDIYRFSNAELEHTRENLKDMSCRTFTDKERKLCFVFAFPIKLCGNARVHAW